MIRINKRAMVKGTKIGFMILIIVILISLLPYAYSEIAGAYNVTISNMTITPSPANTLDTLNCSGFYMNNNSNKGNVSITWYNGSTLFSNKTVYNLNSGDMVSSEMGEKLPLAYWSFNQFDNLTDLRTGGNVQVIGGMNNITHYNAGFKDWAYNFTGKIGYINVSEGIGSTGIFNITQAISVSAWFKKPSGSSEQGIVDKGRDGYGGWLLNVDEQSGKVSFKVRISGVNRVIVALINYPSNNWTHVVGTFNGTTLAIYQNGVLSNSASYSGIIGSNNIRINIGRYSDNIAYFNGSIDEVGIYNYALNASDILNLYQNKSVGDFGQQAVGETWNCTINATDSAGNVGAPNSSSVTVNSEPFIQNITIVPATAYTNSTLNCSANVGDADSDKTNVTIRWFNGATLNGTITVLNAVAGQMVSNSTIAGIVTKGETWNCTINATDSAGNVGAPNSTTREISNTNPELTTPTISPTNPPTFVDLNCSFRILDVDLNKLNASIRWYNNSKAINGIGTFLNLENNSLISYNLTSANLTGGDVWICEGWVFDGTANSTIANSSSVTVNSEPFIQNITIVPATAYTNSTLNCSANVGDADSDKTNVTIRWFNGATLNGTITVLNAVAGQMVSNSTIAGIVTKGETWNCTINATDSAGNVGAPNSTTKTISDLAPIVTLQAPNNRTNTTDNTPDFIFNYTDVDLILGNCILYVNGSNVGSNAATPTGVNTTITSSALTDGLNQNWYVNCSDGTSTTQSEIRVIGIDTTSPVLTIAKPLGEYFTYGLPYLNLPINFSYVEANPDTVSYSISPIIHCEAAISVCDNDNASGSDIIGKFNSTRYYNFSKVSPAVLHMRDLLYSDGNVNRTLLCFNTSNLWENFSTQVKPGSAGILDTEEIIPNQCLYTNLDKVQIRDDVNSTSDATALTEIEFYIVSKKSTTLISNSSFNFTSGSFNISITINDTSGNEGSSSSSFSINLLNASSSASKGNVTESEQVTFTLQINSTNITTINATFYYNDTTYNYGTRVNNSKQANFTKIFNIPLGMGNISYYWNYTINSHNNVTTKYNITISKAEINNCTTGIKAYYFSMKDETNSTDIILDFATAITYWIDNVNINKTLNISMTDRMNYSICISPNYTSYTTNVQIEYSSLIFSKRYYYLINATLNNVTQNINLYSLLSSMATLTSIEAYDQYTDPIESVIIHIQRYDISTDSYYVVGMAKTSHEGKDGVYLEWYNTIYKFLLFQNNELKKISPPQKIASSPIIFIITTEQLFPYDEFGNIQYSLTFNNDTGNFILVFADSSGQISAGCLKVINRTALKDEILCDICQESASATLYCPIDKNVSGTYWAMFYAKGSPPQIIDSISKTVRGIRRAIYDYIGNLDGTVLAIIFAGTASFAFLVNPILAVLAMILGLFGAMSLGFTMIEWSVFWGVAIIGGILMWKLRT